MAVALEVGGFAAQNMPKFTPDRSLALTLFDNKSPYSLQYSCYQKTSQKVSGFSQQNVCTYQAIPPDKSKRNSVAGTLHV